jgi:hypothetical protein
VTRHHYLKVRIRFRWKIRIFRCAASSRRTVGPSEFSLRFHWRPLGTRVMLKLEPSFLRFVVSCRMSSTLFYSSLHAFLVWCLNRVATLHFTWHCSSSGGNNERYLNSVITVCSLDLCYLGDRFEFRWQTVVTEVLSGSPQSLNENTGVVPSLGHDHFLKNPFQLINHGSSWHLTLYTSISDTDSIVK